MVFLSDYRQSRETTDRHYGNSEDMELVWNDVLSELNVAFTNEMYEEARLQTNIEIYEEVWNHEITKVEAQLKQLQEVDLLPLRMEVREKVEALLPQ